MLATFAALGEPNRLRIVELLRTGPRPVNAIGASLNLNQPQVSKHLRVLKEAGWVDVEAQAQQRVYALRPEPLRALSRWLLEYRGIWDARFAALDGVVAALNAQTAPPRHRPLAKKEKPHARHQPR